jgi:pyrroline-5-carboxylate reductase
MEKSIGFIGGGRITTIFLQAFANKNIPLKSVYVNEIDQNVLNNLQKKFPHVISADLNELFDSDIIFIALHPPAIRETLEKIAGKLKTDVVVISLAPKISSEMISKLSGVKNVVRMIPNATSVINEGINPVCFVDNCSRKEEIFELISVLGYTFETEESKLEAYAIISAMLPTYFWFQWTEMIEIGKQIGLTDTECNIAVQKTLRASLNTLFNSTLTKEEVFDLIPIKPIGEHEEEIVDIYRTKLIDLHNKITP